MSSTHTSHRGAAESPDDDAGAADREEQSDRAHASDLDETWTALVARWNELREYAGYYVAANIDRLRLSGRAALMWSILGIIAGLVAVSIVAASAVMLVVGLAAGVGELLGGRIWLGQLVVGVTILLTATGGGWLVVTRNLQKFQHTLVQKYERRKAEERTDYGTDVEQRAQERSQKTQ